MRVVPSIVWRISGLLVAFGGSGMIAPVPVDGQVVEGRVIDVQTGAAVGAGFVVLLDAGGREVRRVLAGADGAFRLRAPEPGSYRVRSERIGFRMTVSEPVEIVSAATVTLSLRVDALPVRLADLEVREDTECSVRPDEGATMVALWEEIRKALTAANWTGGQPVYRFHMYAYQRDLTADRGRVVRESGRTTRGVYAAPYRSVDPEILANDGFIVTQDDGVWYYLPDALTLLDDSFLDTHCFSVTRDRDRPGEVGLSFEPAADREIADVSGVLWVNEISAELRALEIRYSRLPGDLDDDRVGGTVEFLQLSSGAWIVRRWQIRTPVVEVQESEFGGNRRRRRRATAIGFHDIGSEVMRILSLANTIIYEAPMAYVTGTVTDATTRGLDGATVTIVGTDLGATTDGDGSFRLGAPIEGTYDLTFRHPRLDSLAYTPAPRPVRFTRAENTSVAFRIPPVEAIVAERCPSHHDPDDRTIVGVARDAAGRPVADARVTAQWQTFPALDDARVAVRDWGRETTTDGGGRFVLCGLPTRAAIVVRAAAPGVASRTATVEFPETVGGDIVLGWDREAGIALTDGYPVPYPIFQVDFTMVAPGGGGLPAAAPY